ncbi:tyrosine-type recombinase/integrase [Deinococcus sp. 6GRE01]|uniref:tyrosine-type recombinase/integrase n=1 Tax=Deinococcus sp. 6GRE01 TaxID=2745873 RepID=UPI001E5B021A|nr:tyrosine-type recombinase/integrase [Deinococcus sp. 6GRE01]MCD0156095.1 site-specific integrase [Deinococcus sp. 6GRE01]
MTGRNSNGAGCVKQLPSGSYRWQITLGFDERGKQLLKSGTEKTRQLAERARVQALADHQRGLLPVPSQIRVSDWMEKWLALKKPSLAAKTYANYEYVLRKHLLPLLGSRKVQELKPSDVRSAYVQLADRGFSKSLLHQVRVILRQGLQEAMMDEIVGRNVAEVARLPGFRKGRPARALTTDETTTFLKAAYGTRLGVLFEFMVSTGLRRGEGCALRWEHLDLQAGMLFVRDNVTVVNGKATLGTPKTESAVRDLHLPPETVALLREHRAAQLLERAGAEVWEETGHVFTNARGQRLYPDSLTKLARNLAAGAGLGHVRFHDLRHTYASLMLARGVPMEVVSEKLGHSRTSTTADIYRHVYVEEHQQHTLSLSELLAPRPLKLRSAAMAVPQDGQDHRVA